MTAEAAHDGPLGRIVLAEAAGRIVGLRFGGEARGPSSALLDEARRQLDAYFAGEAQGFTLPLAPAAGLDALFRAALLAIGFGATRTYGDLAKELGQTPQAIGQLCGANPLPVLVPCHRVLAASGLGGYSGGGGIKTKVALLRLEGAAGLLI